MIRVAETDDWALLPGIEAASDRLVEPFGYWPLPELEPDAPPPGRVAFVAGRPPVGFVLVDPVDGASHVAQLSVHPAHGRRGIGTRLLERACDRGRAVGHGRITLTTYSDIPFNAPWYHQFGFREIEPDGPELTAIVERERPLAVLGGRVTMAMLL